MVTPNVDELNSVLEGLEVDKVGVVRLADCPDSPLADKAKKLLPGAQSVVVVAIEVFAEVVSYLTPRALVGEMTLRDLYVRNIDLVSGLLNRATYDIVKKLHEAGYRGLPLPDGGPYEGRFLEGALSFKHVAQAAGLGFIGWNSLLLTPEYGPRVRLSCVITDAPLNASALSDSERLCERCKGACMKVCPAKAIQKPEDGEAYRLDKHACNTYITATGQCGECMKVCPAGKKT